MARVMIVDDEQKILDSLGRMLKGEGYEVKLVPSGSEALGLLKDDLPDVILLDVRMPGIDGLEVCKEIRANKDKDVSTIPIIMITGYFYEKEEILKLGADDCLEKPLEKKEILRRIACALKVGKLSDKTERLRIYSEELDKTGGEQ